MNHSSVNRSTSYTSIAIPCITIPYNSYYQADTDLETFLSEEHTFDEYNTVSLLDNSS